mgnify:CR=1 FL=1
MNRILLIDDDENLGPPLAAYFQRFELQLKTLFCVPDVVGREPSALEH